MPKVSCSLCNNQVETRTMVAAQKLDTPTIELIKQERPDWDGKRGICNNCRERLRAKKFLSYLEAESAKLSDLEKSLVSKIARRGRVSKIVEKEFQEQMTFGERLADTVAHFGGSWTFIMIFAAILIGWMVLNTVILVSPRNFDPYPFILLNLVLSTLAALQAPIIMMSQNRQAEKDRMQAQQDYEINLMAEVEIRDLHDKLDALRYKQWHELWHLQQRQIELLELLHVAVKAPEAAPEPPPFTPPEL
jgi:uncharacterized membrane protein